MGLAWCGTAGDWPRDFRRLSLLLNTARPRPSLLRVLSIIRKSLSRALEVSAIFLSLTLLSPPPAGAGAASDSACLAELDRVQAGMSEFNRLYEQCRAAGIPLDYPAVAKTTLEQFIPLARADVEGADPKRAGYEVKDLQHTLAASLAEMKAFLQTPSLAPNARRFETSKEVQVRGLS